MSAIAAGEHRTLWAWTRLGGGAAILAALVWRLGTGPFVAGVRMVDVWSLAAGMSIALLTTVCCAWRWSVVARGLGADLRLRPAVAAYYRSQFLNTTLPGGILGDVHRAVRHGREVDDVGRGLRAVGWERFAGQVVQAALAFVVLLALPSPLRSSMPLVAGVTVAGVLVVVLLARAVPRGGATRWRRALRTAGQDLRGGLLSHRAWPAVVGASVVVVVGHTVTFVIAARTAGSDASVLRLLPLGLLVLLSMAVPLSIGGWGPREGTAAWAFGAAGLSPGQGVSTAVVYGVLVLVASLPGAAVLVVGWLSERSRQPAEPDQTPAAAVPRPLEGAWHG